MTASRLFFILFLACLWPADASAQTPPMLTSAVASFGRTIVIVRFSQPLAAASVRPEYFSLSGGVIVLGTTLGLDPQVVQVRTTGQPAGQALTLTVSGVRNATPFANRIAPGSSIAVAAAVLPAEIVARVGAPAAGWHLVASLDLPVTGNLNAAESAYTFDERHAFAPFSRVAYYLELEKSDSSVQFVWAAMDAFTIDRAQLGVPTATTASVWQQPVVNLDVISNVSGVVNGSALGGGNLEFWPGDSTPENAANVPNASAATFDFGDTFIPGAGYGSMQIHNHDAAQTVLAVNHFGTDGQTLDLGIGSAPAGSPDWTDAANAGEFTRRVLHVLVLPVAIPALPAVVATNVPEAAGYQLVYSLAIPASGNVGSLVYGVDYHTHVGPFTRVAYYLETKLGSQPTKFVWASMDAFTADAGKIGVPTVSSGAVFQRNVANMNVVSNVAGIVTGTGFAGGNLEFWPGDYTAGNAAAVPNASNTAYDFGDTVVAGAGYGSMQLHNHDAQQTLFAFNHWGLLAGTNAFGLGLGSQASGHPDWTFSDNAAIYSTRVLHVFVLPGNPDAIGPVPVSAIGSSTLDRLIVGFDEPVADNSAAPAHFTISGLTVYGATLLAGKKELALTTSPQTPGSAYTVAISGVRDRTTGANLVAPGAAIAFTAVAPQAVLANVPEAAGYRLIHKLALPTTTPRWNLRPITYSIDESRYGEQLFDRVAYLLELDGQWVYASFDRHVSQLRQVGVPTLGVSPAPLQQNIAHLNVASNVIGLVTGSDLAGGNIEFWGGNWIAPNALGISNASDTALDFGDTMTAGGEGCMQIHNHAANQTIFSYNNWGSILNQTSATGIGNNPNAGTPGQGGTQAADWSFCGNATSFTTRNLYVLVRPGGAPTGPPPALLFQPVSRWLAPGGETTFAVGVAGAGPFSYQWRFNAVAIPGATEPWLDLSGVTFAQTGSYEVVVTGPNLAITTSAAATLTVNHAPTFSGYSCLVQKDHALTVSLAALVAKAADADGETPAVSSVSPASAQGGTVSFSASALLYAPPTGFTGTDTFALTLADAHGGSVVGAVTVNIAHQAANAAQQSALLRLPSAALEALFYGLPGQLYEIQRTTDLRNPAAWLTLAARPAADDATLLFTDPAPPAGQAFYRTRTNSP